MDWQRITPICRDACKVTLEIRFIEGRHFTTATCQVTADRAETITQLYEAACDALKDKHHSFVWNPNGTNRCEPTLLLGNLDSTDSSYDMTRWSRTDEYRAWFDRHVLCGQADKLGIEIHLNHDTSGRDRQAGWSRRDYLMVEDTETRDLETVSKWEPGTADFFSGRPVTFCSVQDPRWTEEVCASRIFSCRVHADHCTTEAG